MSSAEMAVAVFVVSSPGAYWCPLKGHFCAALLPFCVQLGWCNSFRGHLWTGARNKLIKKLCIKRTKGGVSLNFDQFSSLTLCCRNSTDVSCSSCQCCTGKHLWKHCLSWQGCLINEKVLNCWKHMLKLSNIKSIHVKTGLFDCIPAIYCI